MEHLTGKFQGMNRQSFAWHEAGWGYRFLAAALATLMPAAIGSCALFSESITLLQFGMVWQSCLAESFLLLWFLRSPKPGRSSIIFAYGTGVFAFLLCTSVLVPQWQLFMIPVILAIVLYRIVKLIRTDSIVQSHKEVMMHDFIAVFVFIVYLGWMATSSHGVATDVRQIVLFSTVSVLVGRICLSWGLERMDSIATGKSPLFSLLCVFFVFVGIVVLLVPELFTLFIRLLALILSGIFLVVYKPILWLLSLIVRHRPQLTQSLNPPVVTVSEQAQASHHPWVSMVMSQHILEGIRVLAILICVSVLLIYIYKKWMTKERAFNHNQEPISVSRTWIWRKRRLTFEQTDDEERIRYQKWLFVQHGKGYTIRDEETAQEFLSRLQNGEQAATLLQKNHDVTHRYERYRYGKKNDR